MMTVTPFHGQVSLLTAYSPGAVGIVHVNGDGVESLLAQLTGQPDWPVSHVKLVDLGGVDHGLAARLPRDGAVLMPHGGMRVVDKLIERLIELGAVYEAQPVARRVYPEAQTDMEADMLMCLSVAASPGAVDLLLAQPVRWQRWLNRSSASAGGNDDGFSPTPRQVLDRGTQLDRLIDPPRVVVTGLPNVGKSTLTNRMLGRAASLVADLPGTTRDWVGGLAQLDQVAVRWADTPGLRPDGDAVEQRAIELAAEVIGQADVLVAVRDAQTCWPTDDVLRHRQPDVWVINKIDRANSDDSGEGRQAASPLGISAKTGQGVGRLVHRVLDQLGLASLRADELWAFSDTLRWAMATGDDAALRRYVGS